MRVYLVKTEDEFTRLALAKYQEEIKLANVQQSTSSRSNQRGHTQKTHCSTKSLMSGQKLKGKLNMVGHNNS